MCPPLFFCTVERGSRTNLSAVVAMIEVCLEQSYDNSRPEPVSTAHAWSSSYDRTCLEQHSAGRAWSSAQQNKLAPQRSSSTTV